MINFHITGVDTTNSDLVNTLVGNIMTSFPTCNQWGFNVTDTTTIDLYVDLGAL